MLITHPSNGNSRSRNSFGGINELEVSALKTHRYSNLPLQSALNLIEALVGLGRMPNKASLSHGWRKVCLEQTLTALAGPKGGGQDARNSPPSA